MSQSHVFQAATYDLIVFRKWGSILSPNITFPHLMSTKKRSAVISQCLCQGFVTNASQSWKVEREVFICFCCFSDHLICFHQPVSVAQEVEISWDGQGQTWAGHYSVLQCLLWVRHRHRSVGPILTWLTGSESESCDWFQLKESIN